MISEAEVLSNLAPEHQDDLQASTITSSSIRQCQIKAVPPNMLRMLCGIASAYEIPYFNLDNTRNGFSRMKLFYEDSFTGDRKQKYHQPKDSGVEAYLPPIVRWSEVAADPTKLVEVVEGEKKSIALTQSGFPTIGLGGVWNHTDHLASGEAFVVPVLTQFIWKGRHVELIPDSDGWRQGKRLNVLGGLYVLGMWLTRQGALVSFVKIPELPDLKKAGADDFLASKKYLAKEEWLALERIPIAERQFDDLSIWYQRREEKHQTHDAIRNEGNDSLTVEELGGSYTVQSPAHSTTITFDRFHSSGSRLTAEMEIAVAGVVLRSAIEHSLKSESAHTTLAKNLLTYTDRVPWRWFIPQACALVLRRYREGSPLVKIDQFSVCAPLTYSLNPLVLRRKPTILFCDGGKGKSTLALFGGMLVSLGASAAGLAALKGVVLYLDYEDDKDVHTRRLHALRAGHPELNDAVVFYHRPTDRLARCIPEIARKIRECDATFLIIDSLLMAAGGGSDAESTEAFFAALRRFDLDTLTIGHTPKIIPEGQERPTIYGSVFNGNLARNTFELTGDQEPGSHVSYLTLVHRKSNLNNKHAPIGLKVTYKPDGSFIQYETADMNQTPELQKNLPVWGQIRSLLEDGIHRTAKQVAEELGLNLKTVRAHLSKYTGKKWMALTEEGSDTVYTVLNPREGRA